MWKSGFARWKYSTFVIYVYTYSENLLDEIKCSRFTKVKIRFNHSLNVSIVGSQSYTVKIGKKGRLCQIF